MDAICTRFGHASLTKTGQLVNERGLTLLNLVPYRANAGVARRAYSTAHPAGGDVEPGSYPCAPFLPTALRNGAGTYLPYQNSSQPARGPHVPTGLIGMLV